MNYEEIKTRHSVSVAKKAAWYTSVSSLKTIGAISTKFIYVVQLIYTTSQTKFENNSPHSLFASNTYLKSDFICIFLLSTKCTR